MGCPPRSECYQMLEQGRADQPHVLSHVLQAHETCRLWGVDPGEVGDLPLPDRQTDTADVVCAGRRRYLGNGWQAFANVQGRPGFRRNAQHDPQLQKREHDRGSQRSGFPIRSRRPGASSQRPLRRMAWSCFDCGRAFSDRYIDAERRAAAHDLGVHAHHCQPLWEWRALKRAER